MKISPECVPCMLNRLLFETNLVNPSCGYVVMKEACKILADGLSEKANSAELATIAHYKTYELLGCIDPYTEIKQLAMSVGLRLEDKARNIIENCPEHNRLRTAILISIVGNVLDFGIAGGMNTPDELLHEFDRIYNEGLGYDDVEKLKTYLKRGPTILYFTDNCGEIVFDKLLCAELKKYNVHIYLVVKGEPILSDATLKEAEQINMREVVDQIFTSGEYAVGISLKKLPSDLEEQLNNCDLIISKGMGNFEAFSEMDYKPIMYLLRTKCNPVAESLGLPKDLNVAILFE